MEAREAQVAWLILLLPLVWGARGITRFLCRRLQRERPNFRGDIIPASVGITHLLTALVAYTAPVVWPDPLRRSAYLLLFVAVCFGLLGLVDDLWGSRAVGGFRGHVRALLTGHPTTGGVKLVGGGIAALFAAGMLDGITPVTLLDAALIALAANALNLLDVRPGRAQFGFVLLCLPSLLGGGGSALWLLSPLLLSATGEARDDARARAMMGDTGSNLLGACAATVACCFLPVWGRAVLLALLLSLNLLAERVSITALIERTPWLRALDRRLGVRGETTPQS